MDWQSLFVQYRWPIIGLLGVVGAVLLIGGDNLWPLLRKGWGMLPSVPGEDSDVLDLQAAKRLQARFEKARCPEGTAAVKVVLEHFFHGGSA